MSFITFSRKNPMPTEADPIREQWYVHTDKGQRFQVVAIDEDTGTVEVQHFDGDVEEISLENWYQENIEISEAPENWSGAVDITEKDDFGTEVTDTNPEDWNEPMQEIRPPEKTSYNEESEEPGDEYAEGHMEEQQLPSE
jgi:hypothetical protein